MFKRRPARSHLLAMSMQYVRGIGVLTSHLYVRKCFANQLFTRHLKAHWDASKRTIPFFLAPSIFVSLCTILFAVLVNFPRWPAEQLGGGGCWGEWRGEPDHHWQPQEVHGEQTSPTPSRGGAT